MEQSSSNVFQLKAAAPGGDQLQGLRAAALQSLPPILAGVLAGADDALFDLVQKSHSTFEQQQFFEAMRELRRQRGGIEQRYREHFIAAFAGLEKRKPVLAHYAQPGETSNELSLLDEEELEEQLASEQVAQAIERKHSVILSKLDGQFSQLAGGIEINSRLNPIGPGHMAQSLRAGLRGCDLAASARLVLFKLYEQALLPALTEFYSELHKRLTAAGIGGVVQKASAAPAPQAAPQSAPPPPRRDDSHVRDELFVAFGTSSFEAPLSTQDGREIPYFFTGKRIEFDGQRCVVCIGIDVAERVHADSPAVMTFIVSGGVSGM